MLLKNRKIFSKFEFLKKVNKFLEINLLNKNDLRRHSVVRFALLSLNKKYEKISSTRFHNKCVFTGRNNSVEKRQSISRTSLLRLMRFGIIPGYHKAVW